MSSKRQYRFDGNVSGVLSWTSTQPIDPRESRHEQVSCRAGWFYGMMIGTPIVVSEPQCAADPAQHDPDHKGEGG